MSHATHTRERVARGGVVRLALAAALLCVTLAGCGWSDAPFLRVSGNQLVIGSGTVVQLRGVNRSGLEDKCVEDAGFFDSPTPDQPDSFAMVTAMRSWEINVVRVPLNEGCWLDRGAPAQYSGLAYQQMVESYVHELNGAGLFVILSLQWLGVNGSTADLQPPMPDAANAPSFWGSVSRAFKGDHDVLFDLYNEPYDVSWSCWRNGCEVPAGSSPAASGGTQSWSAYQSAGMQQLVTAVRAGGSDDPILVGGLGYALDLSGWLANAPSDPDNDLIAAVHSYGAGADAVCSASCKSTLVTISQHVPVVFGELGEKDCGTSYIDPMMSFADQHGIGYLGWAWDATSSNGWNCSTGPSLITSYAGTATPYGQGFLSHFQARGEPVGPGAG